MELAGALPSYQHRYTQPSVTRDEESRMAEQLENLSTFVSSSYLMQPAELRNWVRGCFEVGEMVTDFLTLGKSLNSRDPGRDG